MPAKDSFPIPPSVWPWMLALCTTAAHAHDGDLSLVLFGPISFLLSLIAVALARPNWPLGLIAFILWLALIAIVYNAIQVPLNAVYVPPGKEADEITKTLVIFYLAVIPVALFIILVLARRLLSWLRTDS